MLKEINLFVPKEAIQSLDEHSCGGCGATIKERFYLLTVDRAWHLNCLRCCQCDHPLDSELSCYSRNGNIYCKDDYYRTFSCRRCARCESPVGSSELVMRARDLIFHVKCFACLLCGLQLSAGDTAAIKNNQIYCIEHYDIDRLRTGPPIKYHSDDNAVISKNHMRRLKSMQIGVDASHSDGDRDSPELNLELLHSSDLNSGHHSSSLDLSYDGSQSPGSACSVQGIGSNRTKRMRTSFKHNQLRTMKSYFSINQNPDAKDLKQLSQKTGLSKRVLQVWFQNARAKWRRNVVRQDCITGPSGGHSNQSNILTGTNTSLSMDDNLLSSSLLDLSSIDGGGRESLDKAHCMQFSTSY